MRGSSSIRSTPRSRLFVVASLLLTGTLFSVLVWTRSRPESETPKDPFASLRHANETCQVAEIFPFLIGCPDQCARAMSRDEPMYSMGLFWYFAQLNLAKGQSYAEGVNYQCPDELVDNFRTASNSMEAKVLKSSRPGLKFKAQESIHMTLSYVCCLRHNETNWVKETMYDWVLEHYPFGLAVKFDHVECWRERHNSVTTILNVDANSQRAMLQLNRDLERMLLAKGIPIVVPRTRQMPFHTTLFGVFRGETFDVSPDHDMAPDLPDIYKHVTQLSKTMGERWTGQHPMPIRHAPRFTAVGTLHAGKE